MSSARAHDDIFRSVYPAASELERMKAAYGSSSAFDDIQRHIQSMSDTQAILDSLTRPEPPAELFQLPICQVPPVYRYACGTIQVFSGASF